MDNSHSKTSGKWGKLTIRLLGYIVTTLCCWYVFKELSNQNDIRNKLFTTDGLALAIIASTALWIALNASLGIGWKNLLATPEKTITTRVGIALSLRTQIAKYIPGNVFHFAGRVLLAKQSGIGSKAAGIATVTEAILLIAIAGALSLPFFIGWQLTLLAIVSISVTIYFVIKRLPSKFEKWLPTSSKNFTLALTAYFFVLLIQSFIFYLISRVTIPENNWSIIRILESVSTSWVAGFVVIGSPGGIGVRETVFTLFATESFSKNNLLLVGSLMRVAAILGDLLSFPIGYFLTKKHAAPQTEN